jgi:hypothetical protein
MAAASVASTASALADPPSSRIRRATFSTASARRPDNHTRAPSLARRRATAEPTAPLAAKTSTFFDDRSIFLALPARMIRCI